MSSRTSPVALYLAELSPGSRRTMAFALRSACQTWGGTAPGTFLWHRVRVEQVVRLRADLAARLAPNTANKVLAAVKGVLRASWRMGLLDAERLARLCDVRPVKGGPRKRGRCLSAAELRAVYRACAAEGGARGARDAAAVACMYGCRRSEPVAFNVEDYDRGTGRLRVRHAKGNKERDVYVAGAAKRAMDAWLRARGAEPGPLLLPVAANGALVRRRLRDPAMYGICRRLGAAACVEPFSPHDLRRTYAGDLLDAGADVALVQRLMGHANVGTTIGYDRRPSTAVKVAAGLLGRVIDAA
jgi:integrase